ncbi:hypothetical protein OG21DRAFT_1483915 [Imleria badia]|nr:hypothetical protein OG21DRAFT_1483915 [Imleria badia]
MSHVERIQDLCIQLSAGALTHKIYSKLPLRAPRLQNLKISVVHTLEPFPILFDGDPPALRTLELSDCPVPLYSFKLSGLTTLALQYVPSRFQQDMEELLATLSCMQDLTHLYLEDAIASIGGSLSSGAFNDSQTINVPHLSRLLIAAPLSTVIVFLSRVNIPLDAEVRLQCYRERISPPNDHTLVSAVLPIRFRMSRDQAFKLSAPIIRSLVIESAQLGDIKLTFSGSERDCDSFDSISHQVWGHNVPLKIVISSNLLINGYDDDILSNILNCCSIPLTHVQCVHVLGPPYSPAFWRNMLGQLPDLRYLILSIGDMPNLASVLSVTSPTTHEDEENQGGHTPSDQARDYILASMPRLEELELHQITFSGRDHSDTSNLRGLFNALSTRNSPPGRLIMTECGLDDDEDLEDMVRSWDDLEVSGSDSDSLEDASDSD